MATESSPAMALSERRLMLPLNLEVLKRLRSIDPPCSWDLATCSVTAENGHLEVLKWLRSQDQPCP